MKNLTSARPCYIEAVDLYRKHGQSQPLNFANAIRSYAIYKEESGEIEESINLWQEAHDLYLIVDIPEGNAECSGHLSLLYKKSNDIQQSLNWFEKAETAANKSNDPETHKFILDVKKKIEK